MKEYHKKGEVLEVERNVAENAADVIRNHLGLEELEKGKQ